MLSSSATPNSHLLDDHPITFQEVWDVGADCARAAVLHCAGIEHDEDVRRPGAVDFSAERRADARREESVDVIRAPA